MKEVIGQTWDPLRSFVFLFFFHDTGSSDHIVWQFSKDDLNLGIYKVRSISAPTMKTPPSARFISCKGNCRDNPPTESLWGRLNVGRLYGRKFATRREATDEVIDWQSVYNHKRLHSTLGYVSPMTFEQRRTAAQQQDRKAA